MAHKTNSNQDSLSLSYLDGIERIVGLKQHPVFHIPSDVLEKREEYWKKFFNKYAEQRSDETALNIRTLQPCKGGFLRKPLSEIQYWVNTGYLPYKEQTFHMDEDEQSDIELPLLTEECFRPSDHIIEVKANSQCIKQSCNNNCSSSSVDTAAYILSNMNTTNKVETMAIVKGAKHNTEESFQNKENMKVTQITMDKMHATNNENNVLDIDTEENTTQIQRNLEKNTDKDTLSERTIINDKLMPSNKSDYNKWLGERLTYTQDDSENINYIKQDLLNMNLSHINRSSLITEDNMLEDSITKTGHRKKLYTGRDSPIDLVKMKSSNKTVISKLKKDLHPAFDFRNSKLSKKNKIYKKRQSNFSVFNKSLMNNSQLSISNIDKSKWKRNKLKFKESSSKVSDLIESDDVLYINNNNLKNSKKDQSLVECNSDQAMNRSVSIEESINKQNKFNKLVNHLEKINTKKDENINDVTGNFKNFNPIVHLIRLSKDDIERYKSSNKITTNLQNLNRDQSPELINRNHRKSNKSKYNFINLNSNKKYERMKCTTIKLNPVIHLKRISERTIQKYKKANVVLNLKNLSPIILLKRLSESDIQKYKSIDSKRTLNKSNLLSETDQLQNGYVKQLSQFSTLNSSNPISIINLHTEDNTSDQSTLLIYKCDSDNYSTTNLSVLSNNGSQRSPTAIKTINNSTLKTKQIINKKEKEVINNVYNFRKINDKSRLKLNARQNNFNCKNMYNTRNRKLKRKYNMDDSSRINLKNSKTNKDLVLSKDHHTNNVIVSSDNPEIIFKNSNVHANNDKKELDNLFLCDEDDEFVKLVHSIEGVEEKKPRQCSEVLHQNSNNFIKKLDSDTLDATRKSMRYLMVLQKSPSTIKSTSSNQSLSKSITEETELQKKNKNINSSKNQKFQQQHNLSVKEDPNQKLNKSQTLKNNQTKVLANTNVTKNKSMSKVNHLCFKTKFFDSDSESLSMSQCSSNNLLLVDEE